MSNTNLLQETVDFLKRNNKTEKDIIWVGIPHEWFCTWNEFKEIAKNLDYDSGFGGANIDPELVVVGSYFWLERYEYDGSEWWEYKNKPEAPNDHMKIKRSSIMTYKDESED